MVQALIALARKGIPGEVYNICAEKAYKVSDILEIYFDLVGGRVDCELDPTLLRPSDEPVIFGDTSRIRDHTGWAPTRQLPQTLGDMLAFEEERYLGDAI
jgi:nucleoside-diphosphate-sugar epimerase